MITKTDVRYAIASAMVAVALCIPSTGFLAYLLSTTFHLGPVPYLLPAAAFAYWLWLWPQAIRDWRS